MGRPKKVVEEVTEVAQEEVKLSEIKTVAMVRSEDYPIPREANVHVDEVENWSRHGWVKK